MTKASPFVLFDRTTTLTPEMLNAYLEPTGDDHEDLDNETRQASLLQTLDQHKVIYLSGEGRHPSGNWPAEPSVLALNPPLDACKRLGMRFHQNAVLWCGTDAIPHLVLIM
jgi:hypothetical protein